MRKKALLALMMAAVLMLSGCALIQKDQAVDDATEILRLGDQVITKAQFKAENEQNITRQAYIYQSVYQYQVDVTDKDFLAAVQDYTIKDLKTSMAVAAKAKELGMDQLTDEELETVKTNAQQTYDGWVDYIKTNELTDVENMDEETLAKAVEEKLIAYKATMEECLEGARNSLVDDKLYDYVIKDVAVTDEEVQAEYDSKVAANKETYAENAASWAAAANNGYTLYYTPAGVRRVKQILIKFTDDDQTAIKDAKAQLDSANSARTLAQDKIDSAQSHLDAEGITDEDKAKYEAELNAAKQELDDADKALLAANQAVTDATDKAFAAIDEKADSVLAQLAEENADWQKIMDENNEDDGMKTHEKGYAIAEGISGYDAPFVEAALALEKVGDISPKTKGAYGYYIIRYESDEAEGPVAFDDVKESLASSLLSSKKTNTYNDVTNQWAEEAGIKVNLNALND